MAGETIKELLASGAVVPDRPGSKRLVPAAQSVVVPVEPTGDMMLAGALVGPDTNNGQFGYDDARTVFVAMLAAAPAPSSLAGGDVTEAIQNVESFIAEWGNPVLASDLRRILAALSPEAPASEGEV